MRTNTGRSCVQRRGFTLAELMVVVALIGLLATLAFVVLSRALSSARSAVERQTVMSIRNSVESFKQQFGFLPPLVDDLNPVNLNQNVVNTLDDAFLRSETNPTYPRFSIYSIPFYLMGTLGTDIDGVDGPGFTEPQADGRFTKRGREFGAFLDISRDPSRLKRENTRVPVKAAYVDRWGKAATNSAGWPAVNAIRYYRWKPFFSPADGSLRQYLTPRAVGDPNTNFALRDAEFAIVSVGPDGFTDERRPLPVAGTPADTRTDGSAINTVVTKDDIVEFGR